MLDRVDTDVLADHPSLTIWQTGVNDALEEVPIEQFEETLRQGIDVLHGNNVDVILMDMQYYPASARIPYYEDYLKAMREVAEEKRVALFRRYDIVKYGSIPGSSVSTMKCCCMTNFIWRIQAIAVSQRTGGRVGGRIRLNERPKQQCTGCVLWLRRWH